MKIRTAYALSAACLLASLAGGLAGCKLGAGAGPATPPHTTTAPRSGHWQGGPLPLSGKLPSGISTWWQTSNEGPTQPTTVTLRWEDVTKPGARVVLRGGDGAQLLAPQPSGGWPLPVNAASTLTVQVQATAGTSFLIVETEQGGRRSVQAIALQQPGQNPGDAQRTRQDYARDAQGEAIVRMQASPASR